MSKYTIIRNPLNLVNKYEAWYAGDAEGPDERGYMTVRKVVKPVKAFRTEKAAESFINYQEQVKSFKEAA